MIKIKLSGNFDKMYQQLLLSNPDFKELVSERVLIFIRNSEDTRLKNHPLRKRMRGKWAFSITNDIRVIYRWKGKNTVRFLTIGSHKDVYRKLVKFSSS